MAIETKCSVCGEMVQSYFCKHCGFEIHILPNEISPAVMSYEQERTKKYREILKEKEEYQKKEAKLLENDAEKQKRIDSLTSQYNVLEEELTQHREAAKLVEHEMPLAFMVMMQGSSASAIFEIHEGENSFGYTKSHDRHQQIICNAPIADVHFSISAKLKKDAKGRVRPKFYLTPREGKIYGSLGKANVIAKELELEKNDSFFIEEVRFTIVAKN